MKRKKDYFENIEQRIESLLSDIHGIKTPVTEDNDDLRRERIQKHLNRAVIPINLNLNGSLELIIAKDKMSASFDFFPPSGSGRPITLDMIRKKLNEAGITYGINWEIIEKHVNNCNRNRSTFQDVIFAKGKKPVSQIPEHLLLLDKFLKSGSPVISGRQRVDFKKITPFVFVSEREVLAELIPEVEGIPGIDVFSNPVPFEVSRSKILKQGENTYIEGSCLKAKYFGNVEIKNGAITVTQVLLISRDVDYSTGHINFQGDVIIQGEVHDGFFVNSGGSILCKSPLNATRIVSEKNIVVHGGIIGRKEGYVKASGYICSNFIEGCYVEAQEDILILNEILNSLVNTVGVVEMGEKGVIIGGKIWSKKGIKCHQLGAMNNSRTEIICGTDHISMEKLKEVQKQHSALTDYLEKLNELINHKGSNKKVGEYKVKLENTINLLQSQAGDLLMNIEEDENATVVVTGPVYPGVCIEICNVIYVVRNRLDRVVFSLDKENGRIAVKKFH